MPSLPGFPFRVENPGDGPGADVDVALAPAREQPGGEGVDEDADARDLPGAIAAITSGNGTTS